MTGGRLFVLLLVLALGGPVVVAFVSRTPAAIRLAKPPPQAAAADRGDHFTPAEISRDGDYQGPNYLSIAFSLAITIVTLLWLARGPVSWMVQRLERVPGGWVVQTIVVAAIVTAVLTAVTLPLGYVGYVIDKAWALSTQSAAGWLSDQARGLLVTGITSIVTAVAFFGLVRWQPRVWWLSAWAAFSLLTVLLVFLYPLVIAPLFNKFTPLDDPSLVAKVHRLATDAGVHIDQVLVSDASKRTTAENAYVAGLGNSKQLVVYDTLLAQQNVKETEFIIAHELGHEQKGHVVKGVVIACGGLLLAFAVLRWLATQDSVWRWGGAQGIADLRALPLLILFATVASVLTLPVQNAISRHFESQADAVAMQLTHDPAPAVAAFRRLAFANLSDLRPPELAVWLLYTHPPVPDRIRAVLSQAKTAP
jgi:Zn-dependent protease with chaperone function